MNKVCPLLSSLKTGFCRIFEDLRRFLKFYARFCDIKRNLRTMADYIVAGKFEHDKKITGKMYGSSNQRIIKIEEDY